MRARIAHHQARRPSIWTTREEPLAVAAAIGAVAPGTVVLLDCLALLVSNLLLANEADPEPSIVSEVAALLHLARERELNLIVITNEVGMGLVPEYPLGSYPLPTSL